MDDEPTKDLATRAFQKRVIDELAAVRRDLTEIRGQQMAMARNIAVLDQRVTSIEQHVTSIDQRVTSIDQRVTSIDQRVTSIEQRVTSLDERVTSIDHRLTTLEEKVDARLKETRPIWEAVQAQLQRVVEKFDVVLRDIYDVRIDVIVHGRRIGELERRPP